MPHTAVTATFPPMRTASAADLTSPNAVPPERSASAAAYIRPRPPVQARGTHQVSSSSQSSPASSFVDRAYESEGSGSPLAEENEVSMRGTSWWDSSASAQTPTATSFYQVDSSAVSSTSNGFISLMDQQPTIGPSTTHSSSQRTSLDLDDDDDLGLGNSKPKPKAQAREEEEKEKEAALKKEEAKPQQLPEQKPSAAKSWFSISRLWSGSGEQPSGPIKASLGDESSFYYDKELKKWVNKNVSRAFEMIVAVADDCRLLPRRKRRRHRPHRHLHARRQLPLAQRLASGRLRHQHLRLLDRHQQLTFPLSLRLCMLVCDPVWHRQTPSHPLLLPGLVLASARHRRRAGLGHQLRSAIFVADMLTYSNRKETQALKLSNRLFLLPFSSFALVLSPR